MADGNYAPTCAWTGASGATYNYWVYPVGQPLKGEAGNYIFARLDERRRWVPVYIGQTNDLSERFDYHHAMDCIRRNGATHIHAHLNHDARARLSEETDLRASHWTSCNKQ